MKMVDAFALKIVLFFEFYFCLITYLFSIKEYNNAIKFFID